MSIATTASFKDFDLKIEVLTALDELGYIAPTPIQAGTIPLLLEGRDLIGQAQTGTGKTAAFALPLLSRIELETFRPQILVLTPTRELAIQVADSFTRYGKHLPELQVLAVYGGQEYGVQLKRLKFGAHVIVGTPGRIMDHLRRKTLKLDSLSTLVLDEADEMLRMGFIEDVEWILEHTPETRQTALFSATIPPPIRNIANRHLVNPATLEIQKQAGAAQTIRQRYWLVDGAHKLDALNRILEGESTDGVIIFVKTRHTTMNLAERLEERGLKCMPLNGEISQNMRERTVEQFKAGKLDILIATDVAARGLDVDRVSHVINYDLPPDSEAYVHRIGRTGRAGRSGQAISFVARREQGLLRMLEKTLRQKMEPMTLPTSRDLNKLRIERFKQRMLDALDALPPEEEGVYSEMLEAIRAQTQLPPIKIAAALARLAQGDQPLLLNEREERKKQQAQYDGSGAPIDPGAKRYERGERNRHNARTERTSRQRAFENDERSHKQDRSTGRAGSYEPRRHFEQRDGRMERYRIEVGHTHGAKAGHIMGAIANEAQLDGGSIGRIEIFDRYSTVDLPRDLPAQILRTLEKTRVSGIKLQLSKFEGDYQKASPAESGTHRRKSTSQNSSKGKRPFNTALEGKRLHRHKQ